MPVLIAAPQNQNLLRTLNPQERKLSDAPTPKNRTMQLFEKYGMQSVSHVHPVEEPAARVNLGQVKTRDEDLVWIAHLLANELLAAGLLSDLDIDGSAVLGLIRAFYDRYLTDVPSDLRSKYGSTSDEGLLCNWLLLHLIKPDAYIESGVFVGASLRLADIALPDARKWAYDLSFAPLKHRVDAITYIQNEWFDEAPDLAGHASAFAFFDDHIDPVQRIIQCYEVGIEWVLFDDCPSFTRLHRYRYPAVPSISMILDSSMPDGTVIEWKHASEVRTLRYTHNASYCLRARELINGAVDMSEVFTRVGLSCGDKVLVRLKR